MGLPRLDDRAQARLHEHIERLVMQHGLEWREEEGIHFLDSEGNVGSDWFRSPKLANEWDYWVALHEVGHHVLKLPTFDEHDSVMWDNEAAVWEWALANAIIVPSERASVLFRVMLESYEDQRPDPAAVVRVKAAVPDGVGEMTFREP